MDHTQKKKIALEYLAAYKLAKVADEAFTQAYQNKLAWDYEKTRLLCVMRENSITLEGV